MKILVNNNKERIQIIKADLNEKITDESVYWEFDTISEGVKKLHNTFIVNYEIKEDSGTYYYKYTNAVVLLNYIGDKNSSIKKFLKSRNYIPINKIFDTYIFKRY